MWGAIIGITAASVALAVLQQTFESRGQQPEKPGPPRALGAPDPNAPKTPPGGTIKAPLFQTGTAQEALKRAKRFFK